MHHVTPTAPIKAAGSECWTSTREGSEVLLFGPDLSCSFKKTALLAATQALCLPLTLHYMWEKVTGNRCFHDSSTVSQRGRPGLSMVAVEEASLWSGSGKGCLGSRLTAGIWRASKKGVLFVTVCQVRVNGAGEGAAVQRACVRSKWRGRQGAFLGI